MASQVVFCLLTFSVYSPHISQNDPLKCKCSDVFPCLNNIHWLFFSLGIKAKVLPRLISPTQHSPPLLVISLILPPTALPFVHLQFPLAFLMFHRNARDVVRAFGLPGSFTWGTFPSQIVTWLGLISFELSPYQWRLPWLHYLQLNPFSMLTFSVPLPCLIFPFSA